MRDFTVLTIEGATTAEAQSNLINGIDQAFPNKMVSLIALVGSIEIREIPAIQQLPGKATQYPMMVLMAAVSIRDIAPGDQHVDVHLPPPPPQEQGTLKPV